VDVTKLRGESWKARAAEAKGRVQARHLKINATGAARAAAYEAENHCLCLERIVP